MGRGPGAKFRKLKYSIYNSDPLAKNWLCSQNVNILLGRVPPVGLGTWERSRVEFKITMGTHSKKGAGEGSLSLLVGSIYSNPSHERQDFLTLTGLCICLPTCLLLVPHSYTLKQSPSSDASCTLYVEPYSWASPGRDLILERKQALVALVDQPSLLFVSMNEYQGIIRHLRKTNRMKEKNLSQKTLGNIGEVKTC